MIDSSVIATTPLMLWLCKDPQPTKVTGIRVFVVLSGMRTGGLEEANCLPVINLPVCILHSNANSSYCPIRNAGNMGELQGGIKTSLAFDRKVWIMLCVSSSAVLIYTVMLATDGTLRPTSSTQLFSIGQGDSNAGSWFECRTWWCQKVIMKSA
jgi:hypothetical protein